MDLPKLRMVLAEDLTSDHIAAYALRNNLRLANVIKQDKAKDTPRESVYQTANGRTNIHCIEDYKLGLTYLIVTGDDVESMAMKLRKAFPTYKLDDAFKLAREAQAAHEKTLALYYLALLGPRELDKRIFRYFEQCFSDGSSEVRGAAVLAVAYLGWKEFEEPLNRLAEQEPTEDIRKDAKLLAARLAVL